MTAIAHPSYDRTDAPFLVRMAIVLGVFETLMVVGFGLVTRMLDGTVEQSLVALLLVIGLAGVVILPGIWTRARSIEGIAGAAAIGLGATVTFLILDVALLQPLGLYTFRWRAIGGGTNWWYHPVWWILGTYLSWQGAFMLANQTTRRGEPSVAGVVILTTLLAGILGVLGVAVHFPGATWNVPTFGLAVIPALALGTLITGLMPRRSGA
ncbi:MAG: hypothetical protein AB7I33_12865 [Gemmatimonadales bacterium]